MVCPLVRHLHCDIQQRRDVPELLMLLVDGLDQEQASWRAGLTLKGRDVGISHQTR